MEITQWDDLEVSHDLMPRFDMTEMKTLISQSIIQRLWERCAFKIIHITVKFNFIHLLALGPHIFGSTKEFPLLLASACPDFSIREITKEYLICLWYLCLLPLHSILQRPLFKEFMLLNWAHQIDSLIVGSPITVRCEKSIVSRSHLFTSFGE